NNRNTSRDRLIEPRSYGCTSTGNRTDREGLLIRRIRADILFVGSVEHLIVVHAVAQPNRRGAFVEWIPRDTESWREIALRGFDYVFAIRRSSWHAKTECLEVLAVDDQAVAEVARAGNAISRAGNLRRFGG